MENLLETFRDKTKELLEEKRLIDERTQAQNERCAELRDLIDQARQTLEEDKLSLIEWISSINKLLGTLELSSYYVAPCVDEAELIVQGKEEVLPSLGYNKNIFYETRIYRRSAAAILRSSTHSEDLIEYVRATDNRNHIRRVIPLMLDALQTEGLDMYRRKKDLSQNIARLEKKLNILTKEKNQ